MAKKAVKQKVKKEQQENVLFLFSKSQLKYATEAFEMYRKVFRDDFLKDIVKSEIQNRMLKHHFGLENNNALAEIERKYKKEISEIEKSLFQKSK